MKINAKIISEKVDYYIDSLILNECDCEYYGDGNGDDEEEDNDKDMKIINDGGDDEELNECSCDKLK